MGIHNTGICLAIAMWVSPMDGESAERTDSMACVSLGVCNLHFPIDKMSGVLCACIRDSTRFTLP